MMEGRKEEREKKNRGKGKEERQEGKKVSILLA